MERMSHCMYLQNTYYNILYVVMLDVIVRVAQALTGSVTCSCVHVADIHDLSTLYNSDLEDDETEPRTGSRTGATAKKDRLDMILLNNDQTYHYFFL